ncbi:hypothetical protein L218DRAFT_945680 [Marasmius fiardii PR-910]|nr:hypothetical protein L218DRAFT_945680 [Marasmius fiardii PR-910]
MQNTESRGGYSAFFSSGYRAIRSRAELPVNKSFTYPFPSIHSSESPICQDCKRTSVSRTLRSPPEDSRKRRHSVIRFFDKIASNTSDAHDAKERRRSSFEFDMWTRIHVATGLQKGASRQARGEKHPLHQQQTIDPFSSSPESKSFFIELADSPIHIRSPSVHNHPKRNPLSSARETSFTFPILRERPTSVHTLPTPRPSNYRQRSSVYSVTSYLGKAGGELDQDSGEIDVSLPEEWIDPAELDWRQFHIQFLDDSEQ